LLLLTISQSLCRFPKSAANIEGAIIELILIIFGKFKHKKKRSKTPLSIYYPK